MAKTVETTTLNGKQVKIIYIKSSDESGGTISGKYTCGVLYENTKTNPGTWVEAKEGNIAAGPGYDEEKYTSLTDYAIKLAADKEGLTITGNFVPVAPE
tara:strand:- start:76 stop:372 length:297 start_codon:yes stop_codon:yes gene_type:complete